jgi:DNA-binding response OmpR family regulator
MEGFSLESVHDGIRGLERARSREHSLVILDLMLPGMPGLEVLRQLRSSSTIPVIILTARGEEIDRVLGLEIGADDYLAKPFSPRELIARLRALVRRATHFQSARPTMEIAGIKLNSGGPRSLAGRLEAQPDKR